MLLNINKDQINSNKTTKIYKSKKNINVKN